MTGCAGLGESLYKGQQVTHNGAQIYKGQSSDSDEKALGSNGAGGDLENPLSKVYGGSILGETSFIEQALNTLKEGVVTRKEISHRKVLKSAFKSDVVINAVSEYWD